MHIGIVNKKTHQINNLNKLKCTPFSTILSTVQAYLVSFQSWYTEELIGLSLSQEKIYNSALSYNYQLQNVHQTFNVTAAKDMLHKICPSKQNIDATTDLYASATGLVSHENVLLIVTALYEDYQDVFLIHNILYRRQFPNIVFCGPSKKASLDSSYPFAYFREVDKNKKDKSLFYMCVNDAMIRYSDPSIEGYLLLSDDLLFFEWNVDFTKENLDKVWLKKTRLNTYDLITNCHTEGGRKDTTNCAESSWTPFMSHREERNWAKMALTQMRDSNSSILTKCFDTLARKNGGQFRVNYDWYMGDMFYIPASAKYEYLLISEPFIRNNLIHAMAVPTIAKCIEDSHGIYYLPGVNDPATRPKLKTNPKSVINDAIRSRKPFVHPVKFSTLLTGKKSLWSTFLFFIK